MPCALLTTFQDRVYTKAANVPEIWDAGLLLFIKHIIRPPIQQHLIDAILFQIQTEREGYTINRSAVWGCVGILLQLSEPDGPTIYKRDLEPAVLRESEIFYKAEGEKLLQTCDAPEYLRRVSDLYTKLARVTHGPVAGRIPIRCRAGTDASLSLVTNLAASTQDLRAVFAHAASLHHHKSAQLWTGCDDRW